MKTFSRQFGGELQKLFARKRTYIGFGAFLVLELVLLVLLQLPKVEGAFRKIIERSGYLFEDYYSGLTLALATLLWTIFFLGALYLALVGGDVVSKEVEEGTMRMILCRPVSRFRVLVLKFLACLLYTVVLTLFIGLTALLAGLAHRGPGGLFVYAPLEGLFALYEFPEGLLRYTAGVLLLALSLCTVTSLGFLFSCFNMKPAAATILTLSIFFVDSILRNIPYFESIRGWFVTTRMSAWLDAFRPNPIWTNTLEDYLVLAAVGASLFVVGWMGFEQRDLKS